MKKIYLDYAATTPVDKRVVDAMLPFYSDKFGNASSLHSFGTKAKDILEGSRNQLASLLGVYADELLFTSGGTEANNLAIKGVAFANRHKGNHIIVSSIEHDCVINACKWLEGQGFDVTYLPVGEDGIVDPGSVQKTINRQTILVSVMHANNEIGTIQPIREIGEICKRNEILFHTDACQSFGKIPLKATDNYLDLITINSHKIYGPKGVGALYARKGVYLNPILHGGGQERGLRSSTENIPGIVGFAKAAELACHEMSQESLCLTELRENLAEYLFNNFDNFYINGHTGNRLPGNLNFSFHGLEGETIRLLLLLDEMGIAVSAGSACSSNSGSGNASHVLGAIGLNPFEARGGIRVSMGRFTSENEINAFKEAIKSCVMQLNPIYS